MLTRLTRLPLALLAALTLVATVLAATPAQARDLDCGDFRNQAQAQRHLTPGDPHRLDADGDGVACESLPCPCSTRRPGNDPRPSPGNGGSSAGQALVQWARITRVVDGDTVGVRLSSGPRRTVRLVGIDTPEVYGGAECYGAAASRTTKRLLPVGTRVKLVSDPSQDRVDRYDRLLRYVHRGRIDVNKRLVHLGAAKVYVYGGKPFRRTAAYRASQRSAKAADRGLWGAC